MSRFLLSLLSVTATLRVAGARAGTQVCGTDDAAKLLQTFSGLKPAPVQSSAKNIPAFKEPRKLAAPKADSKKMNRVKRKDATMTLSQKLRRHTSQIIKQKTKELLDRVPGMPQMINLLIGWYVHDFVMQARQTSESHRQFVDYLANKMENCTAEQLDIPTMWRLVHLSANHSNLERGMRDFLGEMDAVFAQSGAASPTAMFHVLSKGFAKLGVPAEVTGFMDAVAAMIGDGLGTNGTVEPDTSKLFGLMSNLYRSMGMPAEMISMIDEFGALFATDPANAPEPSAVLTAMARILKKMGMPDAILDFVDDMGKLMEGEADPDPSAILSMMSNVLVKLGAPPEMTAFVKQFGKAMEDVTRGNGTGDAKQAFTTLAKNMQVEFHPEAIFGSFLQMHSDVRDLVLHEPTPSKELLSASIVPHFLTMARGGPLDP